MSVDPQSGAPVRKRAVRTFAEAPIFRDLDATSFTYAFELEYGEAREIDEDDDTLAIDTRHRAAFRLRRIGAALRQLKRDDEHAYDRLIEPIRSFLDDVTMGLPGTNGRPLLFAAAPEEQDDPSRRVWVIRPKRWKYEFESTDTWLHVPGEQRVRPFRMRDSFCVFESGRVFYLLTLTQDEPADEDDAPAESDEAERDVAPEPIDRARCDGAIDEYGVLQFQQLVLHRNVAAGDASYLGFMHQPQEPQRTGDNVAGNPVSLVALAQQRLLALEDQAAAGVGNGVSRILHRFDVVPLVEGARLARVPLTTRHLHRLCIGIESDTLFGVTELVHREFDPDARPERKRTPPRPGDPRARQPKAPTAASLADAANAGWYSGCREAWCESLAPHDDPDNYFKRTDLVLAGVAQGVPDFPWQDESEIHDSTRPAAFSVESTLYVHPRFVMEIAKSWRSYEQGRGEIGTCPYLLLMFVVALHDELIVSEMERQLDDMVYADGPEAAEGGDGRYRVVPMHAVLDVLRRARRMGRSGTAIIETNLKRRFELFRWSSIQRSGNLFRYPKERGALIAIQEAMGTNARFDRAHDIVDRMESLVEDVSALKETYASQRTNWLLFVLTLVSVISLPKDVWELVGGMRGRESGSIYALVALGMVLLLGGWLVFNLWFGSRRSVQDNRPSKSS